MRLRSLLFVPGDRPDRMSKALDVGADALILDLEDAVTTARKPEARREVAGFLARATRKAGLFVRINPIDGPDAARDLDAVAAAGPDGIVLPKAEGARSVERLLQALASRGVGRVPVLPIATETPAAIFGLGTYVAVAGRLAGLTWGAEDLPAEIGASASREPDGRFTPPYEMARSLALFGAAAAGVAPIETVFPDIRDADGLAAFARRAARDGFAGMLAIHPAQVAIINEAFVPSAQAVAHARSVVAAFDAAPESGALQHDGRMIDAPHLKQACRILERAGLVVSSGRR